jgi:hypothetical protein
MSRLLYTTLSCIGVLVIAGLVITRHSSVSRADLHLELRTTLDADLAAGMGSAEFARSRIVSAFLVAAEASQ